MFCNLKMFFQKLDFYIWMKEEKTDLVTVITPTGRTIKKIILKQGEAWLKPGSFT